MNPLRFEQMMVSRFSSRSIVLRTGSLAANTHIRSDCFARRKSHRLKATDRRPAALCGLQHSRNAVDAVSAEDGRS